MTPDQITAHVLEQGDVRVTILNLGAITHDWQVPDHSGTPVPVVLGHADWADYLRYPGHYGTIEGRVANRIGGAGFTLGGQRYDLPANEGPNTLHGGPDGWCHRLWDLDPDGPRAAILRLRSAHGDQGLPGAVDVTVRIALDGHRLSYHFDAIADRPTPINLANHNYYALDGGQPVWGNQLRIAGSRITALDGALIPTGDLPPVAGTKYDFRTMAQVDAADPHHSGIDTNYALDVTDAATPALHMRAANGMAMRLWTDQPGLQVYTGHRVDPMGSALRGQRHGPGMGMAIEAQGFPDAVNHGHFPSVLCGPDRPYHQTTTVEIKPEAGGPDAGCPDAGGT